MTKCKHLKVTKKHDGQTNGKICIRCGRNFPFICRGTYSFEGGRRKVWVVTFPGKKPDVMNNFESALCHALYVFKTPSVMQPLE